MRCGSGDQSTMLPGGPSCATLAARSLHCTTPRRAAGDKLVDESQKQQMDTRTVTTQGVLRNTLWYITMLGTGLCQGVQMEFQAAQS